MNELSSTLKKHIKEKNPIVHFKYEHNSTARCFYYRDNQEKDAIFTWIQSDAMQQNISQLSRKINIYMELYLLVNFVSQTVSRESR